MKDNFQFLISNFQKIVFTVCFLALAVLPSSASALEVAFPSVRDVEVTDSMGPAEWVRYIFLMAQALVGLAIIYALVRSGVEWMTARDNAGQVKTAKDRITGAILGLIILLGSYIFLYTINPQLVQLRNPSVANPQSSRWDFYKNLFGQVGRSDDYAEKISNDCSNTNPTCPPNFLCIDKSTGLSINENVISVGTCTNQNCFVGGVNTCRPVGVPP